MARTVVQLIVSNGVVKKLSGETLTTPTNNSGGALSTSLFAVQSAAAFGNVYYVDGASAKYYKASTDTVEDWEDDVTGGSFPKNSTAYPRLVSLWSARGRMVLSGISDQPHNIFMSKATDPFDFDYGQDTATAAVSLTTANAGANADIVTALIPWVGDNLIVGGEHSIKVLRGDPTAGGVLDTVSDSTGIVWGKAWAVDEHGTAYFFGTNGVYRMRYGAAPECLTEGVLDAAMRAIDHATHRIQMAWDNDYKLLYVFVTPAVSGATVHYTWDRTLGAWWPDQYPNDMGPTAVAAVDGDTPSTRVVLLGGFDGYLRRIDPTAVNDDGTAISSYVVYPPVRLTGNSHDLVAIRMLAALGSTTTNLAWELRAGNSPAEAVNATARFSGTWTSGGRKNDIVERVRGNSVCLKLSNSTNSKTWSVEDIQIEAQVAGRTKV